MVYAELRTGLEVVTSPLTRLGRTTVKLRVLGFMARTRGWITVDEVCRVLQDNHTTPSAVQSALSTLSKEGKLSRGKRGQYAWKKRQTKLGIT